ncbi:PQQ-binding-like beta-propeller repeat protein [candidate division KSB1 bacterium]|nr:PQQ-binding-like beta-propeller repeat protein [candidate division KSB1 bacterium]
MIHVRTRISLSLFLFAFTLHLHALDWQMWRHDAARSAASPEELPAALHLLWSRQYPQREPVWDDPLNCDLMPYDRVFEPIVLGETMFIGFNDCDKVVAIDTETGAEKWSFYADGPVRLPLAGWQDRIFFTSDDGYLYCLAARNGRLLWKFNGAPKQRPILGNQRLISSWLARGGAVVESVNPDDAVVYFTASIFPFMGTFIYAIDARTGEAIWRNEGLGSQYIKQPHNSPSFAGIGPQGVLVISGERLLVPGGRSVPACFAKATGELLYFHLAANNKTGGAFVCANHQVFFNHARERMVDVYDLEDGHNLMRRVGKFPVLTPKIVYFSGETITARDAGSLDDKLWELQQDASGDLIKAGSRLYAGGEHHITAIALNANGAFPAIAWQLPLDGRIERLLAANGKLFAVTYDGRIMAFGKHSKKVRTYPYQNHARVSANRKKSKKALQLARTILGETSIRDGYALLYGIRNGDLPAELVYNSELNFVALEPDARQMLTLRQRYDGTGIYGKRLSLLPGDALSFQPPPYLASLIVVTDLAVNQVLENPPVLDKLFDALRPYGGKLWIQTGKQQSKQLATRVRDGDFPGAELVQSETSTIITRAGKLAGAGTWTHQYGDIANSVKSDDRLVKIPLGLLWFGGNSNVDVLPRHGHGPPEQVIGGRLFVEGMDMISARDVYTGRVLWQVRLDSSISSGMFFDDTYQNTPLNTSYNQVHIPGANARGSNFVATREQVYIIQDTLCHVLDAETGLTRRKILLPADASGSRPQWGYIGVAGNSLIAGAGFAAFARINPDLALDAEAFAKLTPKEQRKINTYENYDRTASNSLVCIDRQSGDVRWQFPARYGFLHNAIIASDSLIFCLDKLPPYYQKKLERRGLAHPDDFRLVALHITSGELAWETQENIFGSWLSFSGEHGLLLQATRPSRDMVRGEEGERMIVYCASDGSVLWDRAIEYKNPPILHGDQIITYHSAYDIQTGEQVTRRDPMTNEVIPWRYTRMYGCNYNIASEHLLSFRSAAAGFYDLLNDGGTGNFGGFKSGCTSNLVVADGVLNAPEYTRTCQCSYPNQTSLALVNMPELEYWTYNDFEWQGAPVRRVGINFNAPGDRMADNGTLWLDYPSVGGVSPDLPIDIEPKHAEGIRRHALFMEPGGLPWVASSALQGDLSIQIELSKTDMQTARYTVHLHFAELENKKPGERMFDILVQDQPVFMGVDIVREAGGANRALIKSLRGVAVKKALTIRLQPAATTPDCEPLICGVEILRED